MTIKHTIPSACPRGTIVALWTGRAPKFVWKENFNFSSLQLYAKVKRHSVFIVEVLTWAIYEICKDESYIL